MTTAEFIKMLQEADPEGTSHVRMEGGVPIAAHQVPGYYDGPYTYIDEHGRYVYTNLGSKVDIFCKDSTSFIWNNDMEWNSFTEDAEVGWEKLKKLFVVDFGAYTVKEQRDERVDGFFKGLREEFDTYVVHKIQSNKKYLDEVLEKHKKGYKFLQQKDGKMKFYDWKILDPKGEDQGANWATTGPILLSGKFEPVEIKDVKEKVGWWSRTKKRLNPEYKGEYLEWVPMSNK